MSVLLSFFRWKVGLRHFDSRNGQEGKRLLPCAILDSSGSLALLLSALRSSTIQCLLLLSASVCSKLIPRNFSMWTCSFRYSEPYLLRLRGPIMVPFLSLQLRANVSGLCGLAAFQLPVELADFRCAQPSVGSGDTTVQHDNS